ncbi:MAG: hypothetical protein K5922_06530 [Clostridiales bacterium]|nr:hypothetical protein [Clostridiales bacterium]
MESVKRELSQKEMEDVSGGCMMPVCSHPRVSVYLEKTEVRFGEKVYLWKCSNCGAEVWCLNVPKTGGATGGW